MRVCKKNEALEINMSTRTHTYSPISEFAVEALEGMILILQ